MANPAGVAGESLVGRELGAAGDGAEACELGVVADGEDHVPVGDLEDLVGNDALMGVAGAPRRDAARQVAGAEVGEHRHLRVEQRHVDRLALAGAIAMAQRGEDRGHGVHAGEEIGDRDADLLRPAAGSVVGDLRARRAGHAHQPAHSLHRVVVAGALAVRARSGRSR